MMTTTETSDILQALLTQNTGRSILDSGDYYGRHHERNQNTEFEQTPIGSLEFYTYKDSTDIIATLSVYHWLKERLEYNPAIDKAFTAYCQDSNKYRDIQSAEEFAHLINGQGLYGDGEPMTVNTYNGEDLLSQVIQYVYWEDESGAHILLQIHGGCDVRGGYTNPVAFDVTEECAIFDNARASIYCNGCNEYWQTDDGCHWYEDGACGRDYRNLETYPATDIQPSYPEKPNPAQQTLPIELPERPKPSAGVIYIDDDRNGHCPHCGHVLAISY